MNEVGRMRARSSGGRPWIRRALLLLLAWWLGVSVARADDQVRQVQEELRKRNLFFGEIDGNTTPALVSAIKKYQARKGFAVTGAVDEETAASLRINANITASVSRAMWPNMPVLRSDAARAIGPEQEEALESKPNETDSSATPAAPAESPPSVDSMTQERVASFVDSYLRDGETQDVATQLRYFAFPVNYFDHGTVDEKFVTRDTRNYVNRWPTRKYMLADTPRFHATGREGELEVEFTLAFTVENRSHNVNGRTRNFWTVRIDGNDLKIVAIREQRIRE